MSSSGASVSSSVGTGVGTSGSVVGNGMTSCFGFTLGDLGGVAGGFTDWTSAVGQGRGMMRRRRTESFDLA